MRHWHELGAEDGGSDEQAFVGERARHGIFDCDTAGPVRLRGLYDRLDHGAVRRRGAEHQIGHDAVERSPGGEPALAPLEFGINGELHRLENRHSHLGEPAPAHLTALESAEWRLLQAFDADGHDLGIRLVRYQGSAIIDLHQAAGDGDAPLREDDEGIAPLHCLDQGAHRHRFERIELHGVGQHDERPHPPELGNADVDRKHRLVIEQRQRESRIEEAYVIERDDSIGPGLAEVVDAFDFHPEQRAINDRERIAERARGHGAADSDRHHEACRAEQEEKL